MGGLAWSGDARSRWPRRSCRTALAVRGWCSGSAAARRTGCHCRSGSYGCDRAPLREELPGGAAVCLVHQAGHRELAGPINGDKEIELPLCRPKLCDVDMEKADRVALEALPLWLVAAHLWQARDAMSL